MLSPWIIAIRLEAIASRLEAVSGVLSCRQAGGFDVSRMSAGHGTSIRSRVAHDRETVVRWQVL